MANDTFREHLDDILRWTRATPGGVLLLDIREKQLSPVHRRIAAEWIRRNHYSLKALNGVGFLVKNAIARGAIRALTWIVTPPSPIRAFVDPEAAEAWAIEFSEAALSA